MNTQSTKTNQAEQAELEKFSKMASQWWDLNGSCKPLHAINPIRLQFIQEHCNLANKNAIDVGCGGGILSESLARSGAKVTAIDLNADLIQVAKLHLLESKLNVDYHATHVADFAKQHTNTFDVVTCMELLEHVIDPKAMIEHCVKLAKPGAMIFFSTINRNWLAYAKAILAAEYIMGMLPKGTHDYDKFIKPSELCQAARECGLELTALKGFDYNPLTKTFYACESVSVNYMVCFSYE